MRPNDKHKRKHNCAKAPNRPSDFRYPIETASVSSYPVVIEQVPVAALFEPKTTAIMNSDTVICGRSMRLAGQNQQEGPRWDRDGRTDETRGRETPRPECK